MLESWPDLGEKELRHVTAVACHDWAGRYAEKFCGSRYNATIALLKHVFDLAIKNGALFTNPAEDLERVAVKPKKLQLPTLAKFVEFIAEMRAGHSRDSKNCADLAESLAYTGMRISEAGQVIRWDVNFEKENLRVSGGPKDATKNGEVRYVPHIPQAKSLFERMIADRPTKTAPRNSFLSRNAKSRWIGPPKKWG